MENDSWWMGYPTIPLPASGVQDAPLVSIQVNMDWLNAVAAAVSMMETSEFWVEGTDLNVAYTQIQNLTFQIINAEAPTGMAEIGDIKQGIQTGDHAGWFLCDGRQMLKADYPELAAVVALSGAWEFDETRFLLPNFIGRAAVGAGTGGGGITTRAQGVTFGTETHTLTVAQMPGHTHNQSVLADSPAYVYGAAGGANRAIGAVNTTNTVLLNTANAGGGLAHPNTQPSLVVNFFIYAGE